MPTIYTIIGIYVLILYPVYSVTNQVPPIGVYDINLNVIFTRYVSPFTQSPIIILFNRFYSLIIIVLYDIIKSGIYLY